MNISLILSIRDFSSAFAKLSSALLLTWFVKSGLVRQNTDEDLVERRVRQNVCQEGDVILCWPDKKYACCATLSRQSFHILDVYSVEDAILKKLRAEEGHCHAIHCEGVQHKILVSSLFAQGSAYIVSLNGSNVESLRSLYSVHVFVISDRTQPVT